MICLLHFLESPLRHFLEKLDGESKDPIATGGIYGDAIKELPKNLKKFVKFDYSLFANVKLPKMDSQLFQNQDLKKFYMLVKMIVTGVPNEKLLNMRLPTIHKARWLTTAIRYLRLYVQTRNPSLVLKKIVKFIILWYFPLFCAIKRYPLIQEAPKHFFNAIGKSLKKVGTTSCQKIICKQNRYNDNNNK